MAGRDRAVILLRIPSALAVIAKVYQDDRDLPSLNAAITELLETHPELVLRVELLYNGASQIPHGEVPP